MTLDGPCALWQFCFLRGSQRGTSVTDIGQAAIFPSDEHRHFSCCLHDSTFRQCDLFRHQATRSPCGVAMIISRRALSSLPTQLSLATWPLEPPPFTAPGTTNCLIGAPYFVLSGRTCIRAPWPSTRHCSVTSGEG